MAAYFRVRSLNVTVTVADMVAINVMLSPSASAVSQKGTVPDACELSPQLTSQAPFAANLKVDVPALRHRLHCQTWSPAKVMQRAVVDQPLKEPAMESAEYPE